MKLAVIVMAAGASKRFGEANKLLQPFRGKPLLQNVLELAAKIPADRRIAVCSNDTSAIAEGCGFTPIRNTEPEKGQSLSMRLGIAECDGCNGAMFLTGDQPFVSPDTLKKLVAAFHKAPDRIIGCSVHGRFCIPSIFPAQVFGELLNQCGDVGGREVMRAHPDLVTLIPIEEREHFDIDTPQDFAEASRQAGLK